MNVERLHPRVAGAFRVVPATDAWAAGPSTRYREIASDAQWSAGKLDEEGQVVGDVAVTFTKESRGSHSLLEVFLPDLPFEDEIEVERLVGTVGEEHRARATRQDGANLCPL